MAEDSFWFRHTATHGKKMEMLRLVHIYTHWAKGIYWDVIEVLRSQEGYRWSSKEPDLQLLCDLIGCKDETRFLNWFKDCLSLGVFASGNDFFWCTWLNDSLKVWESSKAAWEKSAETRKKKAKINGHERNSERKAERKAERILNSATERKAEPEPELKNRIDKSIDNTKVLSSVTPVTDANTLVGELSPTTDLLRKPDHKISGDDGKGKYAWRIKQDTIYFTQDKPVITLPPKAQILDDIMQGVFVQDWQDAATGQFTAKHEPKQMNKLAYDKALQAYGVCKYLYDHLITEYPPEGFKNIREARINKQLDGARLLLTDTKQDIITKAKIVRAAIDWMYSDGRDNKFWRQQCRSTEGLRRNFDGVLAKMMAEEEKQSKNAQ